MQLRSGATELVPAAGINDEERSIRIFDDIGRMEIGTDRAEKIRVPALHGRALVEELVPRNFVQIKERREEVVLEFLAEAPAAEPDQTTGCRGTKLCHAARRNAQSDGGT